MYVCCLFSNNVHSFLVHCSRDISHDSLFFFLGSLLYAYQYDLIWLLIYMRGFWLCLFHYCVTIFPLNKTIMQYIRNSDPDDPRSICFWKLCACVFHWVTYVLCLQERRYVTLEKARANAISLDWKNFVPGTNYPLSVFFSVTTGCYENEYWGATYVTVAIFGHH